MKEQPEEPQEDKQDGFYSLLGMLTGLLIALATSNFPLGLMLGVIISIAMEWVHNLYALYLKNKDDQ
ncbi:hypothetical protein [Enterococcus sp. LJL90]